MLLAPSTHDHTATNALTRVGAAKRRELGRRARRRAAAARAAPRLGRGRRLKRRALGGGDVGKGLGVD